MNSNNVYERNFEEFKQSPDIKTIIEQSWGKQGETILHNKLLPRGSKNTLLIQALGSFGPGLDVLMRALIPQMLVLHIGEMTKNDQRNENRIFTQICKIKNPIRQ